jgi:Flp pilus assembly protein protease CpaA
MKRILAIFLIVAVCVAVPDFAHVQIPADFSHCLSVQAAIAAPTESTNGAGCAAIAVPSSIG